MKIKGRAVSGNGTKENLGIGGNGDDGKRSDDGKRARSRGKTGKAADQTRNANSNNNKSTDQYNKRFQQLLRICQSLTNKQLHLPNPRPKHPSPQSHPNSNPNPNPIPNPNSLTSSLTCTDQTIQTMLHPPRQSCTTNNQSLKIFRERERERCAKSSRSYHQLDLDLPEIKEREYEGEFQSEENQANPNCQKAKKLICLTQRINNSTTNIHQTSKQMESTTHRSSKNLHTSRIKSQSASRDPDRHSSTHKFHKSHRPNQLNTQITPFDRFLPTKPTYPSSSPYPHPHLHPHPHPSHKKRISAEPTNPKTSHKLKINIDIDVKKLLMKNQSKDKGKTQRKFVMVANRNMYCRTSMNCYNRSCHA